MSIKIRAYGLLPITRSLYLRVQTCCFAVLAAVLSWLLLFPPDMSEYAQVAETSDPLVQVPIGLFVMAVDNGPFILLAALLLGVLETWWMLGKFRAAEAHAELMESLRTELSQIEAEQVASTANSSVDTLATPPEQSV